MSQEDIKVIRVTAEQHRRISRFGVAGDTMSDAVENLLSIAENKNAKK